jgi:hypothetical protein
MFFSASGFHTWLIFISFNEVPKSVSNRLAAQLINKKRRAIHPESLKHFLIIRSSVSFGQDMPELAFKP